MFPVSWVSLVWVLGQFWHWRGVGQAHLFSPAMQELLKETRKEHTLRAVELLYAIFCLDMQQLTLTLLGHILPNLLTDSSKWHTLMDPPGKALAK